MEKIMVSKARLSKNHNTIICATRYGNVMGSRGSVMPLFIDLVKKNKPLTITDPQMTRFMMSLKESVNLVIFAFQNAKSGDIFVQKAPATTIENVAKVICEIFNKKLKIQIIGTRHGEKLFETLLSREEMIRAKDMGKFYRIPSDNRDLNYSKYFVKGEKSITNSNDYTSHNAKQLNLIQLKKLITKLNFIKEELNA
jgi:UDP-glucose 4-epimerase